MKINKIYEACSKGLGRFLDFTISNPWKTLAAATLLTVVFGYWGFNIPLRTNLEDLFPETTPHVVRAKATRDQMTSSSQVLMVLSSPDKEANLRFLLDLTQRFSQSPLIGSVEYKKDISFFKKNALLFVSNEDLEDLDAKLKKTIKRAVEKDLDPLADDEEETDSGSTAAQKSGSVVPGDKPIKAEKVEFDDGFGDKDEAEEKPAAEAKPAADAKPVKAEKVEFDDGFGDKDEAEEKPADAKPAADKPLADKPVKAEKVEFDDGFGDKPEADKAEAEKPAVAKEAAKKGGEAADKSSAEAVAEDENFSVPTEQELVKKYGITSLSEYEQSEDGTIMAFRLYPTFAPSDVAKSKELLKFIHDTVDEFNPTSYHPDMEWNMEGDYHSKIEEMAVLYKDLAASTISALALIFLMIALFFRRPRIVLFAFFPLVAGLAWTLGFAYAAMGYLNLITAFIFGVLSGLGVEYSMHVAERYVEERRRGLTPAEAAKESVMRLSRAMVGSVIMTSCGFLALMVFDFRGFSQFGAIAGVGIPLCLMVVYIFFPPMVVVCQRIWPEKPYKEHSANAHKPKLFGSSRKAIAVLSFLAVAAALMLAGVGNMGFEPNMKKVMTPSSENQRAELMKRFRKNVTKGSTSPVALLTKSADETEKVHKFLQEGIDAKKYETLESVKSPFSFVPEDQAQRKAIVDRMHERLQRKIGALKGKDLEDANEAMPYLTPETFDVNDLPDWVKKKFTDKQGNYGTFLVLSARGNKANALEVTKITDELDDIVVEGETYHTSASYYIMKDVYDIVRQEGPLALLLAALAALVTVLLDFRKFSQALVAFFPVLLGVGCFVGLMGWMDEKFTMFNMIILPSMFGTSIDTCTHILHRLREEGPEKVGAIANTTGAATFLGAMTNTFGFGTLVVATNPGLANIGKLAPIGLLLCWLICLGTALSFGYLREVWDRKRSGRA